MTMMILKQAEQWPLRVATQRAPEGLYFEHTPGEGDNHSSVQAYLPGGEYGGGIEWWNDDGEVASIKVPEKHQRKGIGNALYHHVKTNVEPSLHHSNSWDQSDAGAAWAQAIGEGEDNYS